MMWWAGLSEHIHRQKNLVSCSPNVFTKKNPEFSLTNNTNIDGFKKFLTLEDRNSSLGIGETMW